jgi:hypothetical protein
MNWDGSLGNTSFNVDYLQSVTVEEAIATLSSEHVSQNRVVNAWKKANPTKSAKVSKKK